MLDLATAAGAVAEYRSSLDRLSEGLANAFRPLGDPSVPLERRVEGVRAATRSEPRSVAGLLELLVRRGRIGLLPAIARAYADLVDRREGIAKAKITTAVELDEAQQRDAVARLESSSGKTIRATFDVDPSIIGGARVQVGDHLIDSSVRTQLEALRSRLAS